MVLEWTRLKFHSVFKHQNSMLYFRPQCRAFKKLKIRCYFIYKATLSTMYSQIKTKLFFATKKKISYIISETQNWNPLPRLTGSSQTSRAGCSHWGPSYPGAHWHVTSSGSPPHTEGTQTPPCWHGLGWQKSEQNQREEMIANSFFKCMYPLANLKSDPVAAECTD